MFECLVGALSKLLVVFRAPLRVRLNFALGVVMVERLGDVLEGLSIRA